MRAIYFYVIQPHFFHPVPPRPQHHAPSQVHSFLFFSFFFFFNPLIFFWLKFWVNYYWTWNSVHWLYWLAIEPRDAPASISPVLGLEHILMPPMFSVWYGKHFAKWAISPDPVFAVFKTDTEKFKSPQVLYMLNIVGTRRSTSTRHESGRRALGKKRPMGAEREVLPVQNQSYKWCVFLSL